MFWMLPANGQFRLAALLFGALTSLAAAGAERFPVRPVRIIVGAGSGAGPDVLTRILALKLTEAWGEQIVVDNRPGGSGLIGAETVARSTPDGYTLLMASTLHIISSTLAQRLSWEKHFAPVGMVATTPMVLASNTALPVKPVQELIAYAKQRPGQLFYGSAGEASTGHMCVEILARAAGFEMVHVPYKSGPLVLADILSGRIQLTCISAPAMPQFLKSGKARALAVTSAAPSRLAPGVPPIAEVIPGYEVMGWYGLLAPLGTPPEVITRINAAMVTAVKDRPVDERVIAAGAEPVGSTPAELDAFLRKESARWEKALKDAGIRAPQ